MQLDCDTKIIFFMHISLCHTGSAKVSICQEMGGFVLFLPQPEVAKYLTRKLFLNKRSLKIFDTFITFFSELFPKQMLSIETTERLEKEKLKNFLKLRHFKVI